MGVDDRFKAVAVRMMESLGYKIDLEYFCEEDVWSFVGDLAEFASKRRRLSPASLRILLDAGIALGLKPGADEGYFGPALEAQLGPSPHSQETIIDVVRYVRAQVNGFFEDQPPASQDPLINGGPPAGPHHAHKNLDFGSD